MLYPTVIPTLNGVYIEGQQIGLRLFPHAEGTISVSVIGLPAITGFDRSCRLSSCDELPAFAPTEITVYDTKLECFAADKFAPVLHTGFTLELEPGMAQQLRAWLAKLAAVASAAKAIADQFSAQLPPPVYHMLNAITSVVARIVLDGWSVEQSLVYEREHGTWHKHHAFMGQFDAASVQKDLHALARAAATSNDADYTVTAARQADTPSRAGVLP